MSNTANSYQVEQVGKRWFIVRRAIDINDRKFEAWECEATYSTREYDPDQKRWVKNRKWTLTGKGSRAYREGIIKALEGHLKGGVTHE